MVAKQFSGQSDEQLDPFICNPCPLNQPVTAAEVAKALGCLNNGRAPGPDISKELMKYTPSVISTPLANIINMMFEQHTVLDSLRQRHIDYVAETLEATGPSIRPMPYCVSELHQKSHLSCCASPHTRDSKHLHSFFSRGLQTGPQLCRLSLGVTYAYSHSTISSVGFA